MGGNRRTIEPQQKTQQPHPETPTKSGEAEGGGGEEATAVLTTEKGPGASSLTRRDQIREGEGVPPTTRTTGDTQELTAGSSEEVRGS